MSKDTVFGMPPTNMEAEQAVLGCILIEPEVLESVAAILEPFDFYRDIHRFIYKNLTEMAAENEPIDMLTLMARLQRSGEDAISGGYEYLVKLMESPSSSKLAMTYASQIAEMASRRRVQAFCGDLTVKAQDLLQSLQETLLEAERGIIAEQARRGLENPVYQINQAVHQAAKDFQARRDGTAKQKFLTTGLRDLDSVIAGLERGGLTILAGRPGTGKSAILTQLAYHIAACHDQSVLYCSLEMAQSEIVSRLICQHARLDLSQWRKGLIRADAIPRLQESIQHLWNVPLYIDDTRSNNASQIASRARRIIRDSKKPIGLIIVDYLQILSPGRKLENRSLEVGEMASDLKTLARDLDIPVLAAAQLSRRVDERADKRPYLSDLAQSGRLEAESDLVLMLYRDAYYKRSGHEMHDTEMELAELLIAKQRNGPTGTVKVGFFPAYGRFENLA